MSQENIFNNQNSQTTETNQNTQTSQPAFNDLLASITNEKGEQKYRDVNTALDALKHSQDYISQLREEKEKLAREREEWLAERERLKTLEDTVSQLTSTQNTQQQSTTAPVISEEVVANLVTQTLTKREQELVQQKNVSTVVNQMQQSFGADAEKVFYEKANEIGLNAQQINSLAAQSPQAVLKLFGLEQGKSTPPFPSIKTSSVNTSGLEPAKTSYIGRNKSQALVGATTQDLLAERQASNMLVDELHTKGLSVHDLTDPKVYFKHFS